MLGLDGFKQPNIVLSLDLKVWIGNVTKLIGRRERTFSAWFAPSRVICIIRALAKPRLSVTIFLWL